MLPFADRLAAAVREKRNPVVVGLDPRAEQLPPGLLAAERRADPSACAAAYERFCCEVIDAVAALVPAVKPQCAFFEQLGPPGMTALRQVVRHAAAAGLLVILDGKRNDIGTTAEAYAEGYLGPGETSAWGGDALTVSPYLGNDSLQPFVDVARRRGAGIFVLVKTSNPGGGQFQDLECRIWEASPDGDQAKLWEASPDGDRPDPRLYEHVAAHVERLAAETADASGYGAVGAVVGATYPEQLARLRAVMPHAWILIPGYGSQGGTARDAAAGFAADGLGAVVNNSRGIIFAHARKEYAERGARRWQDAVAAAARDMIAALRAETPAGKL